MSENTKRKLAVTAISGNESKWIKGWSESILPIADVVCINLTQFDDNSEELFRKYIPEDKLILIKNKWQKNFSLARNQVQAIVPKDIQMNLFIDLDEVLLPESYPIIEEILNKDDDALYLCNIYNELDKDTNSMASLYYPRFFPIRSASGFEFKPEFSGNVHNQLSLKNAPDIPAIRTTISIFHYGYALSDEEMKKKHSRSEELLRNQIEEDNDSFFAHLNLAQLLRAKGDFEGTIKHAKETMRIIGPSMDEGDPKYSHAFLMSADQLGTAYLAVKDIENALEWSMKAVQKKPDYLDPILNLGNIHLEMHDLEGAENWFKRYLFVRSKYNVEKDGTNLILNHLNSSFIALYNLGIINGMKGKHKEANEYFEKCYKEEPNFRDVFIKVLHSLRLMGKQEEMYRRLDSYMSTKPENAYLIYEYLGDLALDECNIELSKFNYYQATYVGEINDEGYKQRIENKWEAIQELFGEVSNTFFETYDVHKNTANKSITEV